LPRLVRIPDEDQAEQYMQRGLTEGLANTFVWMEEIIAAHLDMLFPGLTVVAAYPFRVTRDVDLEIKDDEASDLLTDMEEELGMRQFGSVIRLEVDQTMPDTVRDVLTRNLYLAPSLVYTVDSPLGMADLMELTHIDRPDLKDAPFLPAVPHALMQKNRRRVCGPASARCAPVPTLQQFHASGGLRGCRGQRPAGLSDQADLVPHRGEFAHRRGAHGGTREP